MSSNKDRNIISFLFFKCTGLLSFKGISVSYPESFSNMNPNFVVLPWLMKLNLVDFLKSLQIRYCQTLNIIPFSKFWYAFHYEQFTAVNCKFIVSFWFFLVYLCFFYPCSQTSNSPEHRACGQVHVSTHKALTLL